jgi:hypothetical protein
VIVEPDGGPVYAGLAAVPWPRRWHQRRQIPEVDEPIICLDLSRQRQQSRGSAPCSLAATNFHDLPHEVMTEMGLKDNASDRDESQAAGRVRAIAVVSLRAKTNGPNARDVLTTEGWALTANIHSRDPGRLDLSRQCQQRRGSATVGSTFGGQFE